MIGVLFGVMLVTLLIGVPVGFSIGMSCLAFLLTAGNPLTILSQRMCDGVSSFTMMALPMFMLSGAIMAYGSSPRLMRLARLIMGKIPGGIGAAGCAALGFFGAVSGSGVASTAAIGGLMGPEMVKDGYGRGITASLMAAGGAMASLIPPSLVMVVYGASSGASIGEMFLAGIIPGVMVIVGLMILIIVIAIKRNYPSGYEKHDLKQIIYIVADALLPLMTPVIILGGVLSGLFTPTESAVISCVYAFFLAVFVYRELDFKKFIKVAADSAVASAVILLIISAATPLGWILAIENVPQNFTAWLLGITSNKYIIIVVITLILLLEGTFMETVSIVILMTPILLPIMKSFGYTAVQFGIILLMNTAIGSLTPPLSVCLFTGCRIVGIRIEDSFPDVLYVMGVVFIVLLVVTIFPQVQSFIPNLLF
ncbi:MAG: TRAP transporter large permease [Oscillospiraceae bacterium]|nr:TRAP transporter large permease [Oscillospiraceae bacterium]